MPWSEKERQGAASGHVSSRKPSAISKQLPAALKESSRLRLASKKSVASRESSDTANGVASAKILRELVVENVILPRFSLCDCLVFSEIPIGPSNGKTSLPVFSIGTWGNNIDKTLSTDR